MILSILTSCHTPSAPSPEAESTHYVKASAKRFSMPASPVKKRNSRLKRKSVVIGTPSGFRHEFHLGRDVNSMAELWDLERWREEIEHRVQEAAAEHAAINAAAAAQAEEESAAKTKRPRPQSMIRRKPVPSLDPSNDVVPEEPVPPMPTVTIISSPLPTATESEESDSSTATPSASSCSSSDDACSDMSSLPPSTPPSTSPRASTDLKYVDMPHLAPVVEPAEDQDEEVFAKTLSASLLTTPPPKSTLIEYGQALSTTDEFEGVCHPPLPGDIAVAS